MDNAPLFSVIIPTYNRASFIGKTIASVLSQSFKDFEVIVVDDGSTDNTRGVVSEIRDARVSYFHKENAERGAARNFGVTKSRGLFVTFLDSDDLYRHHHLEEAHLFYSSHTEANVFALGYDVVHVDGRVIYPFKKLPSPVNRKLEEGNFLSCIGVFIRRQVMVEFPFREERALAGSEDYELWLRLASRYPIYTISKSTAQLVQHDERSVINFSNDKLFARIQTFRSCITSDPQVKHFYGRLSRIFAFMDLYLALHLLMSGEKKTGTSVLCKALYQYPGMISNHRFWAAVKKIFIN